MPPVWPEGPGASLVGVGRIRGSGTFSVSARQALTMARMSDPRALHRATRTSTRSSLRRRSARPGRAPRSGSSTRPRSAPSSTRAARASPKTSRARSSLRVRQAVDLHAAARPSCAPSSSRSPTVASSTSCGCGPAAARHEELTAEIDPRHVPARSRRRSRDSATHQLCACSTAAARPARRDGRCASSPTSRSSRSRRSSASARAPSRPCSVALWKVFEKSWSTPVPLRAPRTIARSEMRKHRITDADVASLVSGHTPQGRPELGELAHALSEFRAASFETAPRPSAALSARLDVGKPSMVSESNESAFNADKIETTSSTSRGNRSRKGLVRQCSHGSLV